jgi:hypothetical protein
MFRLTGNGGILLAVRSRIGVRLGTAILEGLEGLECTQSRRPNHVREFDGARYSTTRSTEVRKSPGARGGRSQREAITERVRAHCFFCRLSFSYWRRGKKKDP